MLPDYLTTPQAVAWEQAIRAAQAHIEGGSVTFLQAGFDAQIRADFLPAICAIVAEWRLDNFPAAVTPETFPASPAKSAGKLITAIVKAISDLLAEEDDIPKA